MSSAPFPRVWRALPLYSYICTRNGGGTCILKICIIINALCTLVQLQGSIFVQREKVIFQQVLKINRLQTKRLLKNLKIRYRMSIFFDRVMSIWRPLVCNVPVWSQFLWRDPVQIMYWHLPIWHKIPEGFLFCFEVSQKSANLVVLVF